MAKRALIVDDEKDARMLWSLVAKESGLEVTETTDGRAAVEILKQDNTFDLVILDVMMPFMDGYEVLKKMREDDQLKHIPVIISTASRTTQNLTEVTLQGPTSFVNKAAGLDSMRRGVAKALNQPS